jgi:hypothetical protein
MNVNEEQLAFYEWVGRAITQWAAIEIALEDVVSACFGDSENVSTAVAFYSIENFRSKLRVVDNLVTARFREHPAFDDWPELLKRAESAAGGRNTIAHHWLLIDPAAKAGRRYGLQPFLSLKPAKKKQARPPGTLCVRDIAILQARFSLLSNALHNFAARLRGRKGQLPESPEQAAHQRTLSDLRRQIHALCGHPPRSSRG